MAVRQRGKMWQADVRVGANHNPTGMEVRLRLSAPTEQAAIALEASARLSIMTTGSFSSESLTPQKAKGTLAAVLRLAWSSGAGKKGGWSHQKSGKVQLAQAEKVVELLGADRLCSSITAKDFDYVVSTWRKMGKSNDTIRMRCQCFYRALDYAVKEGWMTSRPKWERPAPSIPREFTFSEELEKKLVDFFRSTKRDDHFADLIEVAIETGGRLMELLNSTVYEWKLDEGYWLVLAGNAKSGKARTVILSDKAIEIMRRRVEGLKPTDKPMPRVSAKVASERMLSARETLGFTGYKDFVFHALRHTRATRLAAKSQNPFVVQSQLGHEDIKTSMRYIHMAQVNMNTDAWRN